MSEPYAALRSLHTSLIDSRNGYEEALEDADSKGMKPLFREMITLHADQAAELSGYLSRIGQQADPTGSFMSTIHRTVMSVRSRVGGLDESVLPGLIDGEKRNLNAHNEAIVSCAAETEVAKMLGAQRGRLEQTVRGMEARKRAAT